ncbi:site-specific integrase [Streptomyces sp. DH10]|uniref:site-specific integrase n=1 Tax=Streptomyces sp. DH10 TaxID=3040121 RepID=UPI0024424725|nr:site-specific integrase [Streptomyces sp. DH10]MDG9713004.1 site-specific integrase [Streptomyces sp. DH10]
MTTVTGTAEEAGQQAGSLAAIDICEAAGLTVRKGGIRPRVGDLIWSFADVEGLPVSLRPSERKLDFSKVRNPRWRVVAQEFSFARLAPGHEAVRELPQAFRYPVAVKTGHGRLTKLTEWFNWLTGHGVTSLADVTQQHCQAYYLHRSDVRDRKGRVLRPASQEARMHAVQVMQEPAFYNELFTADRFTEGFVPWSGRAPFEVAGCKARGENVAQPLRQEALQPWLAAALYIVETLGPHVLELVRCVRQEEETPTWTSNERWQARLSAAISAHIADDEPLQLLEPTEVASRLHEGWSEEDPLLQVSLNAVARKAGKLTFAHRWLPTMRPLLEQAVAAVGVRPRWGRDAPAVTRADGSSEVPWTEGVAGAMALNFLVDRVRTACMVVVALLTGMRASELMEMPVDACVPPQDLKAGRMRYRLRTKLIKGQELGGVWDEWVTVRQAYDAVQLAVDLQDPQSPSPYAFGRFTFIGRCNTLRTWVNSPEGQRLGLIPIPDEPINLRITRRTLAMELAHRPGGLLAAKIHLKHVTVVTTEGYAARPGGAQAEFLADVAAEEQTRNQNLTLAAFRDSQKGIMPTGPGARDLIDFFASVDQELQAMEAAAPGVKPGDQEVINLLSKRAKTLYLGIANYCWFIDPAKALCLTLAGTPGADKPLAGMCDSARCPQATHHLSHRPVWADSAENKKIFIGNIRRGQQTEKARLQADLDRDLRVLAEIDAATAQGA